MLHLTTSVGARLLRFDEPEKCVWGCEAVDGGAQADDVVGGVVERFVVEGVYLVGADVPAFFFETELDLARDVAGVVGPCVV